MQSNDHRERMTDEYAGNSLLVGAAPPGRAIAAVTQVAPGSIALTALISLPRAAECLSQPTLPFEAPHIAESEDDASPG
jgi:hypothetical protein